MLRSCVAAFASQLDCTLEDIEEIAGGFRSSLHCIIHGYENQPNKMITVIASIDHNGVLEIVVEDQGRA